MSRARRQFLKLGVLGGISYAFMDTLAGESLACERKLGASACAFMIPEFHESSYSARALLGKIREVGFRYVDLSFRETPSGETPFRPLLGASDLQGLKVGCVALRLDGFRDTPSFSVYMEQARREPIEQKIREIGALGASAVYMVPPQPPHEIEPSAVPQPRKSAEGRAVGVGPRGLKMEAFADFMTFLAGAFQRVGVRFCLEPMPGTLLPNDRANLRFIREASHPNLFVLVDNGHSLLAGDDPVESLSVAGNHLGYVQLDDTNGETHSHVPLYTGVLTRKRLERFMSKLVEVGYEGSVGIEIPGLEPMTAAREELSTWTC